MKKIYWTRSGKRYYLIIEDKEGKIHYLNPDGSTNYWGLKEFLAVVIHREYEIGIDERLQGLSYGIRKPGRTFRILGIKTLKDARNQLDMLNKPSDLGYGIVAIVYSKGSMDPDLLVRV